MSHDELDQLIQQAVDKALESRFNGLRDSLNSKLDRITEILEHRVFVLEKANDDLTKRCEHMEKAVANHSKEINTFRQNMNDLEQYSRRNSFNVLGCPAEKFSKAQVNGQAPNYKLAAAHLLTEKLGSTVTATDIDAAHPLSPPKNGKVAIIVKFHQREQRDNLIRQRRKLAGTGVVIQDNLTKTNATFLKSLKDPKYKSKIKTSWSWDGKIYVKLNNDVIKRVQFTDDIDVI